MEPDLHCPSATSFRQQDHVTPFQDRIFAFDPVRALRFPDIGLGASGYRTSELSHTCEATRTGDALQRHLRPNTICRPSNRITPRNKIWHERLSLRRGQAIDHCLYG